MNRFLLFFRSILPRDLAQLEALIGVVFLVIAPNLRWAPWGFNTTLKPEPLMYMALAAIRFSGCAALFICFRPGKHPSRHLLVFTCVPAALGLARMSLFYLNAAALPGFNWASIGLAPGQNPSPFLILRKVGPGVHFALIGIVLVWLFAAKVGRGSSSLPLALPGLDVSPSDTLNSWPRVEIFLWLFVALLPALYWVFPFPSYIYNLGHALAPAFKNSAGIAAQIFFAGAVVILIAIWVIGKDANQALRRSLHWPKLSGLALALAFPLGTAALVIGVRTLLELVQSAALHSPALITSPITVSPHLSDIGLLWVFPAVVAEEVIFRGILQPLFIDRYGIYRGIFLVGIVFGVAHFAQDLTIGYTDAMVVLKLILRLVDCVALSFVAGWLLLRSGSLLPPVATHGLTDFLSATPLASAFPWVGPFIYLLWGVLAYALFRYWPIQTDPISDGESTRPLQFSPTANVKADG